MSSTVSRGPRPPFEVGTTTAPPMPETTRRLVDRLTDRDIIDAVVDFWGDTDSALSHPPVPAYRPMGH